MGIGMKAKVIAGAALAAVGAAASLATLKHVRLYPIAKFGPVAVFETKTPEGERVRVLSQGGVYQSATYLDDRRFDLAFEYYRAFDHVFDGESMANPMRKMLMLGGGGYAYPKHVVSSFSDASIDVVEVDPLITYIARKHFFLDELIAEYQTESNRRLNLITADAQAYVLGACGMDYDVVINDCFAGADPTGGRDDQEACLAVKRALRPGGVYALNVVDEEGEYGDQVCATVDLLSTVFANVYVIPCPDSDFGGACNVMVAACDNPCYFGDVAWAQTAFADE